MRHLLHPKLAPIEKVDKSAFSDVESPGKKFKGDKKGKGKGSGSSDQFMRVPVELLKLGSVGATNKGHRLCFGFNLKTCKETVSKQRCPRGLHLCSVKDCHRQHPALECPKAKKERLYLKKRVSPKFCLPRSQRTFTRSLKQGKFRRSKPRKFQRVRSAVWYLKQFHPRIQPGMIWSTSRRAM